MYLYIFFIIQSKYQNTYPKMYASESKIIFRLLYFCHFVFYKTCFISCYLNFQLSDANHVNLSLLPAVYLCEIILFDKKTNRYIIKPCNEIMHKALWHFKPCAYMLIVKENWV